MQIIVEERDNVLAPHAVEVAVRATGLNFRDVLNALGLYPGDPGPLGGEVAGIVTRIGADVTKFKPGDHVYGECAGGFRSYAITNEFLLAKIPGHLTYNQAAGLPIVYLTSYYGLIELAKIKAGDKVLIHAGSGGVGLAAIQLAKHVGAEIYATASSSKQAYLKALGVVHVYDSRTTDFGKAILADTNNQGIDVILNSLTSEGFIAASLSCLKKNGSFLEIGKRNIYTREEMQDVRPDVTYHIIAIDDLSADKPEHIGDILTVVSDLLTQEKIQALPIMVYPIERVKSAFVTMQQAKHVGKIVVTQPLLVTEQIKPQANYLITGGLGALGLITAKTLAAAGATHLVLTSRNQPNENVLTAIAALHATHPGLNITTLQVDISDKQSVQQLITSIHNKQHPLKGIFHLAGVLDDGVIAEQTEQRFAQVFAPKVNGAWYLHEATQSISLDYFVLFSSIAASMGSPGQSNYAAANSYLDQLAIYRRNNVIYQH